MPKPGVPEDVQKMLNQHFGAKRSVIELEELKLPGNKESTNEETI